MRYIHWFSVFAAAVVCVGMMLGCNHKVAGRPPEGFQAPPNSVNAPIDHPDSHGKCKAPDETDLIEQKQQAFWYPGTDNSDVFEVKLIHCSPSFTPPLGCTPGCGTPFRKNDVDQYNFHVDLSGTASGAPVFGTSGKCYKYEIWHGSRNPKLCNDPNVVVK